MATIQANCPRCGTKQITFDVVAGIATGIEYTWKFHYEVYSKCRRCSLGTVLKISVRTLDHSKNFPNISNVVSYISGLDSMFHVDDYLSIKDQAPVKPPEHLPEDVEKAFKEGAICRSVGCYNASGAMFRLAIDLATKSLLPSMDGTTGGPNKNQRTRLADRLEWLFAQGSLPRSLEPLANCVRNDGNDGAHDGTLTEADASDLLDFATVLFERMFTEPERLRQAEERRAQRRSQPT